MTEEELAREFHKCVDVKILMEQLEGWRKRGMRGDSTEIESKLVDMWRKFREDKICATK